MIIKVCGMREPQNIRDLQTLNVDLMGMIFYKKSSRYVSDVHVPAGLMPDEASVQANGGSERKPKLVGVFVNEMPQTVIQRAVNYHLDYLQLHGTESPTYIRNLRATLLPDICPDIKIIKVINVREASDISKWQQYEDVADMLLFDTKCESKGGSGTKFDWSILNAYDGSLPFLLSGGIGPDDAEAVKAFNHPQCVGIDLNSRFEISPALKDIELLRGFINKLK